MAKKVTYLNVFGYSSINFLGSGAQFLISAWLMYFYTTVCNISAVQAGLIFTVARLLDAIANPIMGFISDNFGKTRLGKKFGRRKFFILAGIPSIIVVFPLLWVSGCSFQYYFIMNLIYEMLFTMVIVPGVTLPAEMTQDAGDRAKLTGAKQYCGTIASAIAAFIPGRLFLMYGQNSSDAFFLTGLSYGVMTGLALIFFYLFTYERPAEEIVYHDNVESVSQLLVKLGSDVVSSMQIRSFRLHCIMMGIGGIFKNLSSGVFTYFIIFVLMMDPHVAADITGYTTLVSSVALLVFIYCCYKYGGPATYRISTVIALVPLVGYYVLALGQIPNMVLLFTVLSLIHTCGRAGIDYVPSYQLSFMADIDEAVTGERREGLFAGVNSLLSKVAAAVEAAVLGIGLEICGFQRNVVVQPDSAVIGIIVITAAVPFILLAITWVASVKLKLDVKNHKLLVEEVHRLKAGGSMADATPAARKVFKTLTGWDYDLCWGNSKKESVHASTVDGKI